MITLGIDEVGRGCLAGPLLVAAVILDKKIVGLKDSKQLSAVQRQLLSDEIIVSAQAYSFGLVEPIEIDKLGLTKATSLAMERALKQIKSNYDEILIDGNINYLSNYSKSRCLIRADNLIPAVSAASIIAKVKRDHMMIELDKNYPGYELSSHKGYGTSRHLALIEQLGPSRIHRFSFKPIKL